MLHSGKVTNGRVVYKSIPEGYPIPGETTAYDEEELDLDAPLNGGVLVKMVALSIDPYLRNRMDPAGDVENSLTLTPGQVMNNFGIGVVLRSENPKTRAGDHVTGFFAFQNYLILGPEVPFQVVQNAHNLPWSVILGAAGGPGATAYIGWKLLAKAKKGETVYISTAAGVVGSVVAQLAKAAGLKVIGSAGSDTKVAFLRDELKIDVAFNYKTTDVLKTLKDAGGIDIYWDNVGGAQLDASLAAAHTHARIIVCGAISNYNGEEPPVYNLRDVQGKRIAMTGFSLADYFADPIYGEALEFLAAAIGRGEIKYREHAYSLKDAGQAILDVQKGKNDGKAVITFS